MKRYYVKSATSHLTSPLVRRIVVAFICVAACVVFLGFTGMYAIGTVNDRDKAQIDRLSSMSEAAKFIDYAQSAENIVSESLIPPYPRNNSARLTAIHANFDTNLPLSTLGYDVVNDYYAFTPILVKLTAILTQAESGDIPGATDQWATVQPSLDQLIDRLHKVLTSREQSVVAASDAADSTRGSAVGLILGASFLVALALIGLFWFVRIFVVGPMGLINERLSSLLYTQTQQLNERINTLEQEVANADIAVSAARHDLKAPLANIKGQAELLMLTTPGLSEQSQEGLESIINISDASVHLISSALERREKRINVKKVDLTLLIQKTLALFDLQTIAIKQQVEAAEAFMDPDLIEHALVNLLSNARKFSAGGIGIGTRISRHASADMVEIWVWNDGAVINQDDKAEIFKPGKQTVEGKKAGGHGLGLTIVKNIVEKHHGAIEVDSHYKVGTTFRIFLPLNPDLSQSEESTISSEIPDGAAV